MQADESAADRAGGQQAEQQAAQQAAPSSVIVLTYATHCQGYFKCLQESCARYGYELRVMGFGEKWQGYGKKLQAVLAALRQMHPQQLVIFVDAFDVFMCGPAAEAVRIYEAADSPKMLVGASRTMCGPNMHKALFGEQTLAVPRCANSPYQNLCSGTYMARAGVLVELLASLEPIGDKDDDQRLLVKLRNKHGDDVVRLDCRWEAFATVLPERLRGDVRAQDKTSVVTMPDGSKRVHCGVHNTYPIAVHGPGDANMMPLVQQMGFESAAAKAPASYTVKKILYHSGNAMQTYKSALYGSVVLLLLLATVAVVAVVVVRYTRQRAQRKTQQQQQQQQSQGGFTPSGTAALEAQETEAPAAVALQ